MPTQWETYEEVARHLLNQFKERFGLENVEGKQKVAGLRSGHTWEVDAKGVNADGTGFVLVECRRYPARRLTGEAMAAFAYRIEDTGATGGITVSPLDPQEGARKVADSSDVLHVLLSEDSSEKDFEMRFLGRLMAGASVAESMVANASFSATVSRRCDGCGQRFDVHSDERLCPDCRG